MKKRLIYLLFSLVLLCILTACENSEISIPKDNPSENKVSTNTVCTSESNNNENTDKTTNTHNSDTPAFNNDSLTKPSATEEKNTMHSIEIIVGNKHFSATLYDNESARALRAKLPMSLDMSELNGNEKYYYLSDSLPTNSSRPSGINEGDLMLYGNDCLVLFYKSFSTSYSYTPLGRINDPDKLAAALGSGSVQVTFR